MNLTPANDSAARIVSTPRFAMYPLAADFAGVPLVMSAGRREAADNDNPAPFSIALNAESPDSLEVAVAAVLSSTAPTGWNVSYGEWGSVFTAVLTKRRTGGAQ